MRRALIVITLLLLVGTFLRLPPFLFPANSVLHPAPGYRTMGFDEGLYWQYVNALSRTGVASYPDIAESYIAEQTRIGDALLPPTRFLYIFLGYLYHSLTG